MAFIILERKGNKNHNKKQTNVRILLTTAIGFVIMMLQRVLKRGIVMPENRIYFCVDMKSFFASVECAERGLNPFETNLVVADETRGGGTICLAITPAMKALGVKNRCRLYEIPKDIKYITAMPSMKKYIQYNGDIYWDNTKPNGTMRKLCDVTKLHSLGWKHSIEIDEGISRLYDWYLKN